MIPTNEPFSHRYNELLRIEEELGDNAIYAGDHFRKAHDM
jgi:enolase